MDSISIKPRSYGVDSTTVQQLRRTNQKEVNAYSATTQFFKVKDFSIPNRNEIFAEREFVQFIAENRDLLTVIEKSDAAKEKLSKTEVSNREELVKILSETAKDILKDENIQDFDTDKLQSRPFLSAFIVSNIGGFVDTLKNNPETAKIFSSNAPDVSEYYFKKMANDTASMFEATSPLSDKSIYTNDPEAGIFLQNNPELVATFSKPQQRYTQDYRYLNKINHPEINTVQEGIVASLAAQLTNSGAYSEDFFNDNIDFAKFVVTASSFGKVPAISSFLNQNPKYGLSNYGSNDIFNAKQLINKVAAFEAHASLTPDHPIDTVFLENNFDLAQAIITNDDLKNGLNKNKTQSDLQNLLGGVKGPPVSSDFQKMLKNSFLSSFGKPKQNLNLRI